MTAARPMRRPVKYLTEELPKPKRYQMQTGWDFFHEAYGAEGFESGIDFESLRADWEKFREPLLQEWVQYLPMTRPWAWWVLDAPEKRQPLNGRLHPFDDPEQQAKDAEYVAQYPKSEWILACRKLYYGLPQVHRHGYEWETEGQYLKRLGLLLPGEEEMPGVPGTDFPHYSDE